MACVRLCSQRVSTKADGFDEIPLSLLKLVPSLQRISKSEERLRSVRVRLTPFFRHTSKERNCRIQVLQLAPVLPHHQSAHPFGCHGVHHILIFAFGGLVGRHSSTCKCPSSLQILLVPMYDEALSENRALQCQDHSQQRMVRTTEPQSLTTDARRLVQHLAVPGSIMICNERLGELPKDDHLDHRIMDSALCQERAAGLDG